LELGRPDPIACEVALVDSEQLALDDLSKALLLFFGDMLPGVAGHVGDRTSARHTTTDNLCNEPANTLPMPKAEGVRIAEGLLDGREALRGSPIGPSEYVSEKVLRSMPHVSVI